MSDEIQKAMQAAAQKAEHQIRAQLGDLMIQNAILVARLEAVQGLLQAAQTPED